MGVNMNMLIKGWDQYANGGMKHIFSNQVDFPKTYRDLDLDEVAYRPADFALWRKSIITLNCNVEMWLRGLDALEADPSLWIEISY